MICVITKYFFIIFCSIYSFLKINNIDFKLRKNIFGVLFAVATSFIIYFTRQNFSFITLILIFVLLTVYLRFFYKKPLTKTIVLSAISLGISYFAYTITSLVAGTICYILFKRLFSETTFNIISYLIIGISQYISVFCLFRIKRLKKGFAEYQSGINNDFGLLISLSLLLIASLFDNQNYSDISGTVILFCVMFIGLSLLLWWKKHITNIYLEKVYKRNIEILENSLEEQQEINSKLKQSNEELSSIIHRDNKLIPAMESAVEEILECNSPYEQKEKSQALLSQLKSMSSERRTILSDYENLHKTLVQTGIFSIDASLKYLMNRAIKDKIAFDISVACDVKESVNDLISENDLNTLILDLGENALIAVRDAETRNVLIVFGTENESFTVSIFDSGLPFEKKVVENLGKRRITTHRNTGGSGIGLMTTAQLLKKHNASLAIDESIDSKSYAKKVSVIFDGLSQCRIVTPTNKITRLL